MSPAPASPGTLARYRLATEGFIDLINLSHGQGLSAFKGFIFFLADVRPPDEDLTDSLIPGRSGMRKLQQSGRLHFFQLVSFSPGSRRLDGSQDEHCDMISRATALKKASSTIHVSGLLYCTVHRVRPWNLRILLSRLSGPIDPPWQTVLTEIVAEESEQNLHHQIIQWRPNAVAPHCSG